MKKKYTYLIVIFLIVASFIAFGRISGNGFINIDDVDYITGNDHIRSGINQESIKWAVTAVVVGNWHPLTLLSHILDWSFFGASAGWHHLVSLLLHISSTILLFLFLNKTTRSLWPSAFVAALFALHPLRVESVAWAAERKDVLSLFFGMASIYAYACYTGSSKRSRYFLCLILFALSLMAKPILVTLPFVLLLLDYWPLERWSREISLPVKNRRHFIGRLLCEKIPFIFLTIVSSMLTLWIHYKGGDFSSMKGLPSLSSLLNAVVFYVSYLGKIFWPVDLSVFYPDEYSFPFGQILASLSILIGITIVVIYFIKKLPFLFMGWFWYLGTLIPVIGLVPSGIQAMADRYTYMPSIGIAIMLAWGLPLLFPNEDVRKKILFPTGIFILAILAVLTWQQCGYWKNSIELWKHNLHVTKDNALSHNSLGLALFAEGKIDEAINHYNKAISLKSDDNSFYNSRGIAYYELGQYQRAIEDYNEAIRLNPHFAVGLYYRGIAYAAIGQYQRAIEDFNMAISLQPDCAVIYFDRGNAYARLGQHQRYLEDFNKAIGLKPDLAQDYYNAGNVYTVAGQYQRAIENYNKAISLNHNYADAYNNRGSIYLNQGNKKLGCPDAQKACSLGTCKMLKWAKGKGACL